MNELTHAILEELHNTFKQKISCYKHFSNVLVSYVSLHRVGRLDDRIVYVRLVDDEIRVTDMFDQRIGVFDIKDPNFPQSLYDWIEDEVC